MRAAAAAAGKTVKVGGAGFTNGILTSAKRPGNPANGFVSAVGASNLDFFSAHHYSSCGTATLSNSATFLRSLRALVDQQGGGGKPIHITEWNIGLGQQCGEAFYSEQRTQSFASAFLTMLQDPAQNIEAAHFYAAMPIMSLFNFTSVAGKVGINPSAWAFWAHTQLKGNAMVRTSVCPSGGACVDGYAAESTSLMALSGQSGTTQTVVLTNDNSASVAYTLRVKGLAGVTPHAALGQARSGDCGQPG
ncbi:MAG: hypothetical protein IPO43_11395 [Rhodoferax sp.]|nr:hypothetical protein [Rhodoferax sp.]